MCRLVGRPRSRPGTAGRLPGEGDGGPGVAPLATPGDWEEEEEEGPTVTLHSI